MKYLTYIYLKHMDLRQIETDQYLVFHILLKYIVYHTINITCMNTFVTSKAG